MPVYPGAFSQARDPASPATPTAGILAGQPPISRFGTPQAARDPARLPAERGSYKTKAEQLILHKNTVQYRVRKAEASLGHPVGDHREDVELALQARHWLGSSVLQPAAAGHDRP